MSIERDIAGLECELGDWEAALKAARSGSDYTIDGVSVTRQDVETVIRPNIRRIKRDLLQAQAKLAGAAAPGVRVAVLP